jgi:leader peptidase (prepilin peptidase)/N-methyltransferase
MLAGAVVAWMAALSGYDIAQRRLPNWLTLPGAGVILVAAGMAGREMPALVGAAALAAVYLVVHLGAPTAMGAGDVKLAFALGALTGCFGVAVWSLAALGAPLLTAV